MLLIIGRGTDFVVFVSAILQIYMLFHPFPQYGPLYAIYSTGQTWASASGKG